MKFGFALAAVMVSFLLNCARLATCALAAVMVSMMLKCADANPMISSASMMKHEPHAWLVMFLLSPLTVFQSGGRVRYDQ